MSSRVAMAAARFTVLAFAGLLGACGGSGSAVAPAPAGPAAAAIDDRRTPQYAGSIPIYAGSVPIYAGSIPIYAGSIPICSQPNATDAECGAIAPATEAIYAAGTPASALPGLHPADLQSAYALPSTTAGSGQTIAIVISGDAPTAAADLAVYRSTFGLPPCTAASGCFTRIDQNGGQSFPAASNTWEMEAAIDTQVASAVCPNCKLVLVESSSTKIKDVMSAIAEGVTRGASVISNSYAYTEDALPPGQRKKFVSPGVAFVAGVGDTSGAISWPASSGFAIAVGGTTLTRSASARGFTETAWPGSGGGCSAVTAKPSWQTGTACANRTTADVSAFADPNPGVAVYISALGTYSGWWTMGGTSVSTPIVAGAVALAGNGAKLTDASYVYAHAAALFAPPSASYAAGLGSPDGIGAF